MTTVFFVRTLPLVIVIALALYFMPRAQAAEIVYTAKPYRKAINRRLMLDVIYQLENGRWGKFGGRGNMTKRTWVAFSRLPYRSSRVKQLAEPVYLSYLGNVISELASNGVDPTAGAVYCGWYYGPSYTAGYFRSHNRLPEIATRAQNLYEDFSRR